jgi:phosphocarrier protein HPr
MLERRVKIVNPLGLHARAAAQLVRLAGTFKSKILLKRIDSSVVADAKSILNVLTLAAPIGSELDLEVNGEDELLAMDAVADLFVRGFGEV